MQQKAMLSSEFHELSDGQAKVLEPLAVLTPIREESQWLREESQQLHQQVNKLGQQLNARISTVEQQVGTLQDAVAQQRDDLFEAVEIVVDERTEKRMILLQDAVRQVPDKDVHAHVRAQESEALPWGAVCATSRRVKIAGRSGDGVAGQQLYLVQQQKS